MNNTQKKRIMNKDKWKYITEEEEFTFCYTMNKNILQIKQMNK